DCAATLCHACFPGFSRYASCGRKFADVNSSCVTGSTLMCSARRIASWLRYGPWSGGILRFMAAVFPITPTLTPRRCPKNRVNRPFPISRRPAPQGIEPLWHQRQLTLVAGVVVGAHYG